MTGGANANRAAQAASKGGGGKSSGGKSGGGSKGGGHQSSHTGGTGRPSIR